MTAAQDTSAAASLTTATPIKHLVVIFQENVSFDHYFGTYPHALNPSGQPSFNAAPATPAADTLESAGLLAPKNPNSVQPFRLDRTQALTCDQNHEYLAEQEAVDNGKMDKFVQATDSGGTGNKAQFCPKGVVMGYYDGNTVTGLWNYAQHYAMNDNSFGTVYGPSTPGALNLVAGDTGTAVCGPTDNSMYNSPGACSSTTAPATTIGSTTKVGTVIGDPDQYYDDWSKGGYGSKYTTALASRNIGDMLNVGNATWGWFNGGFRDNTTKHADLAYDQYVGTNPAKDPNGSLTDYSAHHESFQYFASTSNPHHLAPSSVATIGTTDQANHQYDMSDFWSAAYAGNLPAVSFLKAPRYQDGHAGYSDPLDEQAFLVDTINQLQSLPSWKSTAVIISYDDSDGWYDHVRSPIVNRSNTPIDAGCGSVTDGAPARCGYGPRLPYLVISPYARTNYIDHTLTDQTSTLRFIEDNWLGGQRVSAQSFDNKAGSINSMFDFSQTGAHRLYLNPESGQGMPFDQGFEVTFDSTQPGQGAVYFGPGPGCTGLVEVATRDQGIGTTHHTVLVTGNDLPGTVGDIGITPGATYSFEAVTTTANGTEMNNNRGACYTVTVP
ncbi:MAG: alkaline phosphatase family protein [Chloroflexota bacterium]